jgi:mono/diheme cytochrome c family protein
LRSLAKLLIVSAACWLFFGCDTQVRKSDAELGLNAQQASGRRVYDRYCALCHDAYSSRSLRGPSLQGLFKKQFMPSGAPSNDERVREVINLGRSKMPSFGTVLNEQQMTDLLAYLHTL